MLSREAHFLYELIIGLLAGKTRKRKQESGALGKRQDQHISTYIANDFLSLRSIKMQCPVSLVNLLEQYQNMYVPVPGKLYKAAFPLFQGPALI